MTAGRINQVSSHTQLSLLSHWQREEKWLMYVYTETERHWQRDTPCVLATHDDASTTLTNGPSPQSWNRISVPVHLQPLTNGIFNARLRAGIISSRLKSRDWLSHLLLERRRQEEMSMCLSPGSTNFQVGNARGMTFDQNYNRQ
jgi:hypothetical protein